MRPPVRAQYVTPVVKHKDKALYLLSVDLLWTEIWEPESFGVSPARIAGGRGKRSGSWAFGPPSPRCAMPVAFGLDDPRDEGMSACQVKGQRWESQREKPTVAHFARREP